MRWIGESNGFYDGTKREKRWRGEIGQWGNGYEGMRTGQ